MLLEKKIFSLKEAEDLEKENVKLTWDLEGFINGEQVVAQAGTFDIRLKSPYGSVSIGHFPGDQGKIAFDRAIVEETQGMICVPYRYSLEGKIEMLLIEEARPAANSDPHIPTRRDANGMEHVWFAHFPMGFDEEAVKGRISNLFKNVKNEFAEEVGLRIKGISYPTGVSCIWPNPTFITTCNTKIVYAEIDYSEFKKPIRDGHEIISGYKFYSMSEIFEILQTGVTSSGATVRQGVFSTAMLAFLSDFRDKIFILK